MVEPVDIIVAPEYESQVGTLLMDWQKRQGLNSVMWVTGEAGDGRKVIFDIPVKVVGHLLYHKIPLEKRPRDPRRPLPQ
jgi:hypothetical protein